MTTILLVATPEESAHLRGLLRVDDTLNCVAVSPEQAAAELNTAIPALIVLDAGLPSTFEIFQRIKSTPAWSVVPIIFLLDPDELTDTHRHSADDVMTRPIDPMVLRLKIERVLRISAMQGRADLQMRYRQQQDLFHMLIHDMGNAVMMIDAALTYYQDIPPDSPEAVQAVVDAAASGNMLGTMIRDALDLTRFERADMPIRRAPTHLESFIRALLKNFEPLTDDKNVTLVFATESAEDLVIDIDPTLISRVVYNLLINALKFSPYDGKITVELNSENGSGTARLSVRDEGPGIPPDYISRLFDKNEQGRRYRAHEDRAGYGLGLVFSQLAVEAHDGSIWAESESGGGTTFVVELPGA